MRVLAYSTDASSTCCAPPTCSAASATAARSSVLDRPGSAPPSVPMSTAGVEANSRRACLRVWSMVGSGVRVSPAASPSTAKSDTPAAVRAATMIRLATCPSMTNILWPLSSQPSPFLVAAQLDCR